MASRSDVVRRFVAVSLRAWEYALAHPDEAIAALAVASADSAKPEAIAGNRIEMIDAFRLVSPAVPGMPFGTQNEADWERMQKLLVEYGAIKETRPVSQYVTNAFIR